MGDSLASLVEINQYLLDMSEEFLQISKDDFVGLITSKFESITKKQMDNLLACYFPTPDPEPSFIKSQSKRWYRYNQKIHYCFKKYINEINKLPISAKNNISACSEDLINLLPDPADDNKKVSGLVIGKVQSGKTGYFTALIARAVDSGYNLIVVLSGGNFNDLRAQTQNRLNSDLIEPMNKQINDYWHSFTNTVNGNKGDVNDESADRNWNLENKCLIVTKKNPSSLESLNKWAEEILITSRNNGVNLKLLLIDDEADHASQNLNANKKEAETATRINRELRNFIHKFKFHAYVGFTASPYANMFVPPEFDNFTDSDSNLVPTLYPRDFIYSLPTPTEYFGLEKMCPGVVPQWTNHLAEVKKEEAEFYRKNTNVVNLDNGLREGLYNAILDFFISLGVRSIRSDTLVFHHSMLIHLKETKKSMKGIRLMVEELKTNIRNSIFEFEDYEDGFLNVGDTFESCKKFDEYYKKYYSSSQYPSLSDVVGKLQEYLAQRTCSRQPEVLEISSSDEGSDLIYPENRPYAVIAIGGNRLSRGFTLEGLTVSYFIREPVEIKSDTLLQQGRWFGYRGRNEDLVRIYLTESLRDQFWDLKQVENDLHDTVEHFNQNNLKTTHFAVPVMKAKGQIPTSADKLPLKKVMTSRLLSADYLPKSASNFPVNLEKNRTQDELQNQKSLQAVGDFLSMLCRDFGMPEREVGKYVFNGVSLSKIQDLFKKSISDLRSDPYDYQNLDAFLRSRFERYSELNSWTVVVNGNKPNDDQDQEIRFGKCKQKFTLNLIQRSRKNSTSDDLGLVVSQIDDYSIGSKNKSGRTIKQHLANRDSSNPILLINLIDKDSKPRDKNSSRAPLATKDHILTFSIGLPFIKYSKRELSKISVQKWYNELLYLE